MRRTPNRPSPRAGFTLVELLVVMTILAILFALSAAVVVKATVKMDESRVRNDLSQLTAAVQAFKNDFAVAYMPDKLVLPPGFDTASQQYISSLWPRMSGNAATPGPLSSLNKQFALNNQTYNNPFAYWHVPGAQPVVLQGYQTLVFFLGGALDATGNPVGFSTDGTDPMYTVTGLGTMGAATRKGPYFEFPTGRLSVLPSDQGKSPFQGFIDVYGVMPYLYFSSAKAGNDYTNYFINPANSTDLTHTQNGSTLSGPFYAIPYQISSTRYANANSFQIICAGKDTMFHSTMRPDGTTIVGAYAGGLNWAGGSGGVDQGGYDNMANFHPTQLGVAAQ